MWHVYCPYSCLFRDNSSNCFTIYKHNYVYNVIKLESLSYKMIVIKRPRMHDYASFHFYQDLLDLEILTNLCSIFLLWENLYWYIFIINPETQKSECDLYCFVLLFSLYYIKWYIHSFIYLDLQSIQGYGKSYCVMLLCIIM